MPRFINILMFLVSCGTACSAYAQSVRDDFNYEFEAKPLDEVFEVIADPDVEYLLWQEGSEVVASWNYASESTLDQILQDPAFCQAWYYASHEPGERREARRYFAGELIHARGESVFVAALKALDYAHRNATRLRQLLDQSGRTRYTSRFNYGLLNCSYQGDELSANKLSFADAQRVLKYHFFTTRGISQMGVPLNRSLASLILSSDKL